MALELFVIGTHMRGLKLHHNLDNSQFLGEYQTTPRYRIHTIGDNYPGMYRLDDAEIGGHAIWGELYLVDDETYRQLELGEPAHLFRGMVELEDGRQAHGLLYPRSLAEGVFPDISGFEGWRAYWQSRHAGQRHYAYQTDTPSTYSAARRHY